MNKRQYKKTNQKLTLAIRELNNEVSELLGQPYIPDEQVSILAVNIIKNEPVLMNKIFSRYRNKRKKQLII